MSGYVYREVSRPNTEPAEGVTETVEFVGAAATVGCVTVGVVTAAAAFYQEAQLPAVTPSTLEQGIMMASEQATYDLLAGLSEGSFKAAAVSLAVWGTSRLVRCARQSKLGLAKKEK